MTNKFNKHPMSVWYHDCPSPGSYLLVSPRVLWCMMMPCIPTCPLMSKAWCSQHTKHNRSNVNVHSSYAKHWNIWVRCRKQHVSKVFAVFIPNKNAWVLTWHHPPPSSGIVSERPSNTNYRQTDRQDRTYRTDFIPSAAEWNRDMTPT